MLANIITITRLLLIIPFGILLYNKGIQNLVPACLFTFIIITDFLDGYVARKYKQVTKFGKLLDPFVDKLLIVVTTIILIIKNIIPIYSLYIFIRDIIIWILALTIMKKKKIVLAADIYGKTKTVLHFLAILFVLIIGKWNIISFDLLVLSFVTLFPELIYGYKTYLQKDKYEKIVDKKNKKQELSYKELDMYFNAYLNDKINDEVMTKLLKAICKNGLNDKEIINLTDIFIKSGDTLNLDYLGITVDKHSTGGVGDKTTLILAPLLASCNILMPKMSGRGLGYTGGTIDKLESINVNVNLSEKTFIKTVKDIGFCIISQTKNICLMDKKIYALRDVTNTTESIGLIASSIMSKKIACGASKIVIDIKIGNGALIKNYDDAIKLAKIMKKIGKHYNKEVICILTDMTNPLGSNVGNKIEVMEVLDILQNKKDNLLKSLVIDMATEIVMVVKNVSKKDAKKEVITNLENGKAYEKFITYVNRQNGNIDNLKLKKGINVLSEKEGYLKEINALEIGKLSCKLGSGRVKKEDNIDYDAGVILKKEVGSYVKKGDILCTIYGKKQESIDIDKIFKISKNKPKKKESLIIEII
ncbi:MAG TPA: thymidine phosphorylase [Bacilli bacterium]|nr:pyrimidine-nucleoside phosphorylase [Mycoplasma sp. CAG:611]HJJ08192.1 thymidine phosphorylase [Bacilli bacterium]